MQTFLDIPYEHYNDTEYCYNYLNEHKTIGNEDPEYNGIFHVHWRGPIDNDKVILQLKSTLATQEVNKIYFWIENFNTTFLSQGYPKVDQFKKYVEIKLFNYEVFNQTTGDPRNKSKIWQYYNIPHVDRRYKTDMFRWIILNVYGGVYTDADTFLLRDLRDIKIKSWSAKWSTAPYLEGCIIKLQKGSDVYEQMYLNNPDNPQCFLLIQNNLPEAFSFKYNNLNLIPLPDTFFDIVWPHEDQDLKCLTFNNFNKFFQETDQEVTLDNFFKGCFAYHWHNHWNDKELENSYAGKLNKHLDKIIEEKYNIKPYKIFKG
jgi:Glycosyltransferase sugar-binding region containing DXD motif